MHGKHLPQLARQSESGIVLPIVLIFLVIMMLLGVTAIRNVTLEEKMSANVRSQTLAFQAAEQALRTCETLLQRQMLDSSGKIVTIKLLEGGTIASGANKGKFYWEVPDNWTDSTSYEVGKSAAESNLNSGLVAARPRCMIERMNRVVSTINVNEQKEQFRITARGVGARTSTVVLLQSYLVLL